MQTTTIRVNTIYYEQPSNGTTEIGLCSLKMAEGQTKNVGEEGMCRGIFEE